jgi:hypothetical protein
VTVFYGGAAGVGTSRRALFSQDTAGVPGADEPDDSFGGSLAAGDVNGDGYGDLAVGADFESMGSASHAGSVWVLRGGASGLTGAGGQSFNQDTPGVPGVNESSDLSVGAADEDSDNGAVWVLRGSTQGITVTGGVSFGASSVGIGKSGNDPMFGLTMPGT